MDDKIDTELRRLQSHTLMAGYDLDHSRQVHYRETAHQAIKHLIDKLCNEARIREVDDLRREFWRTTWTPYDPDSIFKDRLAELTKGGNNE